MLKIDLIVLGKIKEKYLNEAIDEYKKRISRFATLNIVELKDRDKPDKLSDAELEKIVDEESEEILSKIDETSFVITLEIEGKLLTSEEFADVIKDAGVSGYSKITLIIGGSNGFNSKVSNKADLKLSFGRMTMNHKLMRVVLMEQVFRAFKIINNEAYHK
ncbi:23S rRNA (pseudouridine(1915)-N(3))-methyltransferase RlmH [uncultured Fenollaria sp.]|uniref:23S rRNA (pseudouridine(1915)-N(3))-methyltransferase RlmH n=1 Tax=uncultured Fenollaria sp. TaxID=1686315 RepID=UPI0025CBA4BE|nr:23S rRNA (pseudouridine(1915)-N(3))-methyltransferase RlmH [uncultured Fenollaria sp.]